MSTFRTKKGGETFNIPEGTTAITIESWFEMIPARKVNITAITIPRSVTIIGNYAFANFLNLKHLTIPSSVMVIGTHAFSNCRNLLQISIPNSVMEIGKECFVDCAGLRSVTFEPTHEKESSVVTIGTGAFRRCTSLLDIVIPNSVTEIKDDTFTACHMLQAVNIPTTITSIGKEAFRGCTSLLAVTIPRSMTKINPNTFNGCTSLELVTIPDSVTEIGTGAFTRCPRLNIDFGNIDRLEDPVLIREYPAVLSSYPRTATTIKQLGEKDSCVVRYEWSSNKRRKEEKPTPIEVLDFSGIVSPILLQTLSGDIYEVYGCWNATPDNPVLDFKALAAEQHKDLRPPTSWAFQIPNTDSVVDTIDLGGGRGSVTMMLVRGEITLVEPWFLVWKDEKEPSPPTTSASPTRASPTTSASHSLSVNRGHRRKKTRKKHRIRRTRRRKRKGKSRRRTNTKK